MQTSPQPPFLLHGTDVARRCRQLDAVGVMRAAFEALGAGQAVQPAQTLTLFPGGAGDFITYQGVLAQDKVFGAKLSPYLAQPGPAVVTAWTLLMSMETGHPLLLCDSHGLTTERTAATTALAIELLASPHAKRLALIGTGPVGRAHLRLALGLREWSEVRVLARSAEAAESLAVELSALDGRIGIHRDTAAVVADADVVMLCTSSGVPVLDPRHLTKPALVTSIATNAAQAHEVPPEALADMDVYCDYRATTPASAGEMQLSAAHHGWSASAVVADLAELLRAGAGPVQAPTRHRFFRSIGLGIEDIAMAHALLQSLRRAAA